MNGTSGASSQAGVAYKVQAQGSGTSVGTSFSAQGPGSRSVSPPATFSSNPATRLLPLGLLPLGLLPPELLPPGLLPLGALPPGLLPPSGRRSSGRESLGLGSPQRGPLYLGKSRSGGDRLDRLLIF